MITRALRILAHIVLSVVAGHLWPGSARAADTVVSRDEKRILISKEVGSERWAISYNFAEDRSIQGNVFSATGGEPRFVWCEFAGDDDASLRFSCLGADRCATASCQSEQWAVIGDITVPKSFVEPSDNTEWRSLGDVSVEVAFFEPPSSGTSNGRTSGVQITPDGSRVLVNKDVGAERWTVTRNISDGSVTGNVFRSTAGVPDFLWCQDESGTSVAGSRTYSCYVASVGSSCGDGACSDEENCTSCDLDCGKCPATPFRAGDILVAQSNSGIIRVDPQTGASVNLASPASGNGPHDVALAPGGALYALTLFAPGALFEVRVLRLSDFSSEQTPSCYRCVATTITEQGLLNDYPGGLLVETSGDLLVGMQGNISGHRASIVRVNPSTGTQTVVAEGFLDYIQEIAMHPSDDLIILGNVTFPAGYGSDSVIIRYDLNTGDREELARGGQIQGARGIGIGPDGEILVGGVTPDGESSAIIRLGDGKYIPIEADRLSDVAVGPDGTWFATSPGGTIFRANPQDGTSKVLNYYLYPPTEHFIIVGN